MWPRKNKDRAEDGMKPDDQNQAEAGDNESLDEQTGESGEQEKPHDRIAQLEEQLAQLTQEKLRVIADYQNFARRSAQSENEAKFQGMKAIVLNVIPVLDHFDLALGQDPTKASAEQIISGVSVIRDELLKILQRHGVSIIEPKPGDAFDPNVHQAVLQQQDESVDPGCIVRTLQAGYALNDRAVRPASVSVRPSE
jgi:molecular chaperone GrpE